MNIEGNYILSEKCGFIRKIDHDPIEPDFMTPYQDKMFQEWL